MADYLLASAACYPAFKRRTIDNKSYVDGGYRDNLPIDLAIELGANEIWAVDLQALGHVPQKLMYDIPVRYIRSYWDLGMFITFDPARIRRNMELGYLDTMKTLPANMRRAAAKGFINATDCADYLTKKGMPFRDAYKKVGLDIEAGNFSHSKQVHHTHEGSIGNLCNAEISALMQKVVEEFNFRGMEEAEKALLAR